MPYRITPYMVRGESPIHTGEGIRNGLGRERSLVFSVRLPEKLNSQWRPKKESAGDGCTTPYVGQEWRSPPFPLPGLGTIGRTQRTLRYKIKGNRYRVYTNAINHRASLGPRYTWPGSRRVSTYIAEKRYRDKRTEGDETGGRSRVSEKRILDVPDTWACARH